MPLPHPFAMSAPLRARRRAIACPTPRPAPVTSATLHGRCGPSAANNALAHLPALLAGLAQVRQDALLQHGIVFQAFGCGAEHLLSLFFHGMRIAQPVRQVLFGSRATPPSCWAKAATSGGSISNLRWTSSCAPTCRDAPSCSSATASRTSTSGTCSTALPLVETSVPNVAQPVSY